jgi:UPF0755 protein
VLTVVAVIVALACIWAAWGYFYAPDLNGRTVSVIISRGDGFNTVAKALDSEGVVPSPLMLKVAARLRGIDKKLVPGRYDFAGRNSCRSVLNRLEAGDFLRLRLTVYEGMPIWKVAGLMARVLELDSARIVALNGDSAFCTELGIPQLEGYLYPETYFIPWGTPDTAVIAELVAMFHAQTDSLWRDSMTGELSREEVVTLASIVEAEALFDKEKRVIASVYHNRMAGNMRLDADPTVIYGLGGLDRPLTRRDLRSNTPYNTYRRKGLPPTPINSPGLAALRAVLYPESTDYLFFVADGTGGHRFSRTNAEHNRARREVERMNSEREGES